MELVKNELSLVSGNCALINRLNSLVVALLGLGDLEKPDGHGCKFIVGELGLDFLVVRHVNVSGGDSADSGEADFFDNLFEICEVESAGDAFAPEGFIVSEFLGNWLVCVNVAEIEFTSGFEYSKYFLKYLRLIR